MAVMRRSRPARAPVARIVRYPTRRWVPSSVYVAPDDLGEVDFTISMLLEATWPDSAVSADFAISMILGADIGVTQIIGALLESRSPYNPPSLEGRV